MIYIKIYLENYDWNIYVYILISLQDTDNINTIFNKHCIPLTIKNKAWYRLHNYTNSGIIYNCNLNKYSIIMIGLADSVLDLINTITHEKNHLEIYLCNLYNINPSSEEAAILSGDIALLMFLLLIRLINKCLV